jgi:hypothetical protein
LSNAWPGGGLGAAIARSRKRSSAGPLARTAGCGWQSGSSAFRSSPARRVACATWASTLACEGVASAAALPVL